MRSGSPEGTDRDADPYDVARLIVLDRLTAAPRSRAELRETLARKNTPDDVAEAVLDRMEEVNLVDDAAYARAWVGSRQRGRGLARRALATELRRKGIDDEVAKEALDEIDPDQERRQAEDLVARKLGATRGLPVQTRVRRLSGMLARKGYSSGLALAVVRAVLAGEDQEPDVDLGPSDV